MLTIKPVRIPRMESQTEAYIRKTLSELMYVSKRVGVCESNRMWVYGQVDIPRAPIEGVSTEWLVITNGAGRVGFDTEDVYEIRKSEEYWVIQLYSRFLPPIEE